VSAAELVELGSGQARPDAVALRVLVVTSSSCTVFVNLEATGWSATEMVHGVATIVTPPTGMVIVTSQDPELQPVVMSVHVPVTLSIADVVNPDCVILQPVSVGLPETLHAPTIPVNPPEQVSAKLLV
jgi:hypothetical protein